MASSRIITLFGEAPPSRRGPSGFLVSILVHGITIGLVSIGLRHRIRIDDHSPDVRYTVRVLNLHRTEPPMRWSPRTAAANPVHLAVARAVAPGGRPAPASVPRLLAHQIPARQTLVQPDVPPDLLLQRQTPIPMVVMWSPENSPTKRIVPPPPQEATVANVRPSLEAPNHELNLADLKISATPFVTELPALPPSTTSPLSVQGAQPVEQLQETSSNTTEQPTPARVMSLSDLQLQEGTIAVPLVNETAPGSSSGVLAPGQPESTSEAGNGNPASRQDGMGPGQNPGVHGDLASAGGGPAAKNGAGNGLAHGSGVSSGLGDEPMVTRIQLPENGEFGVVVVGSSLAEEYPETAGLWNGRLAYTVYLHVGLSKNWILQYSLPRETEAAGSTTRPDAPWPYVIAAPHFAPTDTSDTDAILVHGFVNVAGRFEQLAILFPPQFAQEKFLLRTLGEWRFRPAIQQGQVTAVEVLLIIPGEAD